MPHRIRREFRRTLRNSYFPLARVLFDYRVGMVSTAHYQMPRHISNLEAKAGWERGGQLLGRTPGGDHGLEQQL